MWSDMTLAILAGGKATRLGGRAKGLLRVEGQRIFDRILGLAPLFAQTVCVATDPGPYAAWNLPRVEDVREGSGAPGAVVSALLAARTPWVVAVASDMPFVTAHALELLVHERERADVVVFETSGRLQPLPGLFRSALGVRWRAELSKNPSFRELIRPLRKCLVSEATLRAVDPECRTVVSVNTPDDCVRWGATDDSAA